MRRYAMLAIAALFVAVNANAVDLHGYFRSAVGGSSKGGDQVTFKNQGQDYKARLGNEDNWSEFEFVQPLLKDKNGVEWTAGFMLGWGNGFTGDGDFGGPSALQQEYVRATFPQLSGATVWGGKRFYHRHANDLFDYFYMNESGPGVGIEDVDLGFAKMAVALFRFNSGVPDPADSTKTLKGTGNEGSGVVFWMPDFRLEGIPVNPGGTLNVAALAKIRTWNKDVVGEKPKKTQDFSIFGMVKHSQGGILNGGNNLALTYKTGCFISTGCDENLWKATLSEDLSLSPTKMFSITIAGIAAFDGFKDGDKKVTKFSYGIGVRPMIKVADHFAIQADLAETYNKSNQDGDKGKAHSMLKGTIAPTITPFTDGFYGAHSAPEIRFYATYATWDKDQKPEGPGSTFGTDSNGFTFGTQVEAWF